MTSTSVEATIVATGDAYLPSQTNLSQRIFVGSAQNGMLEINASALGNGLTSFTATGLGIGEFGGNGVVKVIGNGTSGSAQININPGFGLRNLMGKGSGLLEIKNGGVVQSYEHVYLGNQSGDFPTVNPGTAITTIDGGGSILRAQQTLTGEWWNQDGGRIEVGSSRESISTVNITNGGLMEAQKGQIGDEPGRGGIEVGSYAGSDSAVIVNVDGVGSTMRASDYIEVGSYGDTKTSSIVNISAGGRIEVTDRGNYFQTSIATLDGTAAVNVNGIGSVLAAQNIGIGGTRSAVGFTSANALVTMVEWNGDEVAGELVRDKSGNVVFDQNGSAVTWVNTALGLEPSTYIINQIYFKTTGSLLVENGGKVQSDNISVSTDSRDVPSYNGQRAVMTVRNGGVVESDVHVFKGGELNGNGTIIGDVFVDGGILAPGNSPGTITVEGDLVLNNGVLEVEIGGAGAGEFDMVHVLGDLIAANGFDVKLKLLNSFTPQAGQEFEFLNINGLANFDFALVDLIVEGGASSGLNLNFSGGKMSLVSAAPVPVPAAVWLFGSGLLGVFGLKRRKYHVAAL